MGDVKSINEKKGFYFFSKDSMKFFNSRIGSTLYGDKFFVTSEKYSTEPRKYTIRVFDETTGNIGTVSEFQEFRTMSAAVSYIKKYLLS